MPGKVNPVIVESLTMVVARVVGNDATIALRARPGQPPRAQRDAAGDRGRAARVDRRCWRPRPRNFSARCIEGLTATDRGPQLVEQGLMLATALAPVIGYDEAAKLAKEALQVRAGRSASWRSSAGWTRPSSTGCSIRPR